MKKKQMTYGLLVVVVFIWGMIGYRFFISLDNSDNSTAIQPMNDNTEMIYSLEEDTFSIVANYPDPFLRNFIGKNMYNNSVLEKNKISVPVKVKQKPKEKPAPVKEEINWSFISYNGLIKNSVTGKMVALVNINGREMMVGEGDMRDDVRFVKNTRDSIQVDYKSTTKYIKRK